MLSTKYDEDPQANHTQCHHQPVEPLKVRGVTKPPSRSAETAGLHGFGQLIGKFRSLNQQGTGQGWKVLNHSQLNGQILVKAPMAACGERFLIMRKKVSYILSKDLLLTPERDT